MILKSNVDYCRSTGSYSRPYGPYTADQLINDGYAFVSEIAVTTRPIDPLNAFYRDAMTQSSVVAIRFYVNVHYKEKPYVVQSQVLFPPNFPLVPPIFSVINSDHAKFVPNKLFAPNPLPDKSYEVKLSSSSNWVRNMLSLEPFFKEFMMTVNQNFPFSRVENPPPTSFPSDFDARYNNPQTVFPFRSPLPPSRDQPLPPQYGAYGQPSGGYGPPKNYQGYAPSYNPLEEYQKGNYQGGWGQPQPPPQSGQGWGAPPPGFGVLDTKAKAELQAKTQQKVFRRVEVLVKALDTLQKEMDNDLKDELSSQEVLLSKKKKIETFQNKSKENIEAIGAKMRKLERSQNELQETFEKFKTKDIDDEMLTKMIRFTNESDADIIQAQARIGALNDTALFVEESFIEKDGVDLEKTLKTLDKLWKQQFEVMLYEKKKSVMKSTI